MTANDPPEIEEIMLDDIGQTIIPERERRAKKHWIIPCLPRMYWFFYRRPSQLLLFIPSLVSSWIMTYSTLTMARILDALNTPEALATVKKLAFYNFVAACVAAVFQFFDTFAWTNVGDLISIKIQRVIFKAMMKKDVEFFDTHTIGDMLTLMSEDVGYVKSAFTFSKSAQVRTIGQLVSNISVSFGIDWRLALFSVFSTAMVSLIGQVFRQAARNQMRSGMKASARGLTIAEESISNSRIVYAFNRQSEEIKRYRAEIDEQCDRSAMGRMLFSLSHALCSLMDWGTVAVCLNLGSYFVMRNEVTAGNLFAVSKTAFSIGNAISMILSTITQEHKAIESADRIFEVVDEEPSVPFEGGRMIPDFRGEIELENVWFKYPTRNSWVMKNVSMKINAGEIVAVVGHSGSGKSTLVQLLLRFYDVNQGVIRLDGVNIKDLDPRWLHQVIGVVQQEPILFAISVRENVCYGFGEGQGATTEEIMRVLEIAQARHFVEKLPQQLDTLIGEKGSSLSGGQKQRIAIARTTIKDPTVMITDEATSALDSQSERKVQIALDEVMKGRTSIIIAHRLGTIRAATKIFVFESGELVEEGSHDELLEKHGCYFTLVQRQMEAHS